MTSQRQLLVPARPAVDDRWYHLLRATAPTANGLYTVLGPPEEKLAVLQERFEASHWRMDPDLRPDGSASRQLHDEAAALRRLAERIDVEEPKLFVKQAYLDRINELLANTDMYDAATHDDQAGFAAANERVYGSPDPAVHGAVVSFLCALAETSSGEAAGTILKMLSSESTSSEYTLAPDSGTFNSVRKLHFGPDGFFAALFGGNLPAEGSMVNCQNGDVFVREILHALDAEDYQLVDSPSDYWGISHDEKYIDRPVEYAMSREEFIAIVSHEVGSHLLERLNGDRQSLRLLSYGLAGYERGNEGRALMREQVAYSTWGRFAKTNRWAEIIGRHLSISVASGLQGSPYDFAATFRLIEAVITVWRQHWPSTVRLSPAEQAWVIVARALKGTNGHGGAFHKDMVYLEGNLACWRVAQHEPMAILAGDAGKYDVSSPRHRELLHALAG